MMYDIFHNSDHQDYCIFSKGSQLCSVPYWYTWVTSYNLFFPSIDVSHLSPCHACHHPLLCPEEGTLSGNSWGRAGGIFFSGYVGCGKDLVWHSFGPCNQICTNISMLAPTEAFIMLRIATFFCHLSINDKNIIAPKTRHQNSEMM